MREGNAGDIRWAHRPDPNDPPMPDDPEPTHDPAHEPPEPPAPPIGDPPAEPGNLPQSTRRSGHDGYGWRRAARTMVNSGQAAAHPVAQPRCGQPAGGPSGSSASRSSIATISRPTTAH